MFPLRCTLTVAACAPSVCPTCRGFRVAEGVQYFLAGGEFKAVSKCLGGSEAYRKAITGAPKVYLRKMMQLDSKLWQREFQKRHTTKDGEWDAAEFKILFSHWEARVRGAGGASVKEQEADKSKETVPLIDPFVQAERNEVRVRLRETLSRSATVTRGIVTQ